MIDFLTEVLKVEKKKAVKEEELFAKTREFLSKEKNEYASFALTTMVMDAFLTGSTIFKVKKDVSEKSPIQENFLEV